MRRLVRIVGFTPDGKGLYLFSSLGANAARLLEVSLTGKRTVSVEDGQYDVTDALTDPRTHKLEAAKLTRESEEWIPIDKSLASDFATIHAIHAGDFTIVSADLDNKTWIVVYDVDSGPYYYYAYNRASRHAEFLFTNRPALRNYTLSKMQPISFSTRDGMTIHGYLTLPVGATLRKLPMVLKVHGGPWVRDAWGLDPEGQWLANRDYAVLQVNFRGSAGYGRAYLDTGDREWGGKMETDLIDGKNWAIKEGYADPRRICIMGASYGGYATLAALVFTPNEFSCGVDFSGPSNLVTFVKSISAAPSIKALYTKRIGNVDTEQDFLKSRSPLFKADQIGLPLLIAQGANDIRVAQSESDQMVAAIREARRLHCIPKRGTQPFTTRELTEVLCGCGSLPRQVSRGPRRIAIRARECRRVSEVNAVRSSACQSALFSLSDRCYIR